MQRATTPSAHTPGPWLIGSSENPDVYTGHRHLVILSGSNDGPDGVIADLETLPESAANARLMAAAPQLRIASQQLYDEIQYYLMGTPDRDLPKALTDAFDELEYAWRFIDGTDTELDECKSRVRRANRHGHTGRRLPSRPAGGD